MEIQTFFEELIAGWDVWRIGAGILCFFWVVALIRVVKDVNARSDNLGSHFLAIVFILVFTPVFGLPLYLACRPQGRKWDKTLWREALLTQLQVCENCHSLVPVSHDCCVHCGSALKVECRECEEWYAVGYEYCPFCWAPHLEE
jgi:RNA polymerase subunit RPABC4/transcription elongation factor Spt4